MSSKKKDHKMTNTDKTKLMNSVSLAGVPGSDGWQTAVVEVTPEVAAIMLQANEGNRKLRRALASRYAASMKAGNWLTAADPIVIGKSGNILNGQHRLEAIIQSDKATKIMVVWGVDDDTFRAHDRGGKRTTSDALRIERRLSEVANILAARTFEAPVTDDKIAAVAEVMQQPHDELLDACSSKTKLFSSAPFRAAATVRILSGFDPDYVTGLYRALCLGHLEDMPPIARSFVGAVVAGRVNSTSGGGKLQTDMLARAWEMFDPRKRERKRMGRIDNASALSEITGILTAAIGSK